MTGVIYARYSSDNQREESIEGQLRECQAFAKKNDIVLLEPYIDRALSAKTDNRPNFQKMIKDSAAKKFDVVIVWKLDRFARNRYDSAHYKSLLRKNGVRVMSATEAISEGAEGILLESMLEGMAEYYSAELSEKVVRGLTENALKCKYNGGKVPIGYRIDEQQYFQIDPLVAPAVLDAFKSYAKGATMQEITDDILRQLRDIVIPAFLALDSRPAILENRRHYRQIDAFKNHLILLEEAMIFGRAGDLQRAEQAFNQYYDSCAQEYRGHEGWKSYQYLRAHLNYLAELAETLDIPIHNRI